MIDRDFLPRITAVVTTYNRFEEAKRAIRSILCQTYSNLEIIVIEDGADSGIEKWIRDSEFEQKLLYYRQQKNKGLAAARNKAIELSTTDFIAFLDDDDVWKKDRIEKQLELITSISEENFKRMGVVYCGCEVHNDSGEVDILQPINVGNLKDAIINDGISTLSSVFLFSKNALIDVGGFDENLPSSIDHDIWMALAKSNYHAFAVYEPLVISYERLNRDTMMVNTKKRITGVMMFTEKWKSTYQEWYGKEAGLVHCKRYYARVISSLVAMKLIEKKYKEVHSAIKSIIDYSGFNIVTMSIILKRIIKTMILNRFPKTARMLRQLINKN